MTPDQIKEAVDAFIADHGAKHWNRAAKKNEEFIAAVYSLTGDLDDTFSLPERILAAMGQSPYCHLGNRYKFGTMQTGWRYCGKTGKCACASQAVSAKLKATDHSARLAKTSATLLARYGNSNPGQAPKAKANHLAFYNDPDRVAAAVEKGRETAIARDSYAGRRLAASQRKIAMRKEYRDRVNTWVDSPAEEGKINCAVCNRSVQMVTAAHCRLHGLSVAQYKERFPNAPMSNEIVNKKRSEAAFGRVISANHRRLISESKLGYAKMDRGKTRITPEARAILDDVAALTVLYETIPLRSMSRMLGVSATFLAEKADGLGIKRFSSSIEQAIVAMIPPDITIVQRSKKIIPPLEIDIFLPEYKLAIEVCGLYYHNDRTKADSYHENKFKRCHEQGIRLLTIFEDEIYDRPHVIQSRIANIVGQSPRGSGARKLVIKSIDRVTANDFYDKFHIQGGSRNNRYSYGAYEGGVLIGAMSFKTSWRANNTEQAGAFELARFATNGIAFAGMASRLFKAFVRDHNPEVVITFADRRWSEGELYLRMGFAKTGNVVRSYSYWKNGMCDRQDKSKFRLQKIAPLVENGGQKTEREIMRELGYYRIYDCGYLKFEWHR